MFYSLYNFFFYRPLYNALVAITAVIPGHDLGLAVVVLTLLVKIVMMPISHKTIKTQKKLKELEPLMAKIKEENKDSQDQAVKTMELYKEHGINPFSGIFLTLLQLPIILALFFVFRDGLDLVSPALYSFTARPDFVSVKLLGIMDLTQKSIVLPFIVGLTQFLQVQLSIPPSLPKNKNEKLSFGESLAQSMTFQTKFILPIFIAFVAYNLNAAVSVYWVVNNLFTIIHELYVKRKALT